MWRQQRERGALAGLVPQKRGRKADPYATERVQMHKRIAQLETELEKARTVIEVQKKLSTLLGVTLPTTEETLTSSSSPSQNWRRS